MTPTSLIKEHMRVYGSDGTLVGVVDRVEDDDRIKLTRSDFADGQHHFIGSELIDHVGDHVHLTRSGEDIVSEWADEDELDLEDEIDDMTNVEQNEEQKQEEWIERRR